MQKQQEQQFQQVFLGKGHCQIQYVPVKLDDLYEKAFYSREEDTNSAYSQNTTTWD